jgi:hypothetical protein
MYEQLKYEADKLEEILDMKESYITEAKSLQQMI